MIRLHATQKLLAKLPLEPDGRLKSKRGLRHASDGAANDAAESPLSGWHANLLLLQRVGCGEVRTAPGCVRDSGAVRGAHRTLRVGTWTAS